MEAAVARHARASAAVAARLAGAGDAEAPARGSCATGTYHVVHFVGHSSFTDDGDGSRCTSRTSRARPDAVDETLFANLLADQDQLRLVVLNSCEGARTTADRPVRRRRHDAHQPRCPGGRRHAVRDQRPAPRSLPGAVLNLSGSPAPTGAPPPRRPRRRRASSGCARVPGSTRSRSTRRTATSTSTRSIRRPGRPRR